jgi:hypothetical protein
MHAIVKKKTLIVCLFIAGLLLEVNAHVIPVKAYSYSLGSVSLNGVNVVEGPQVDLTSRLRSSVTVNATWSLHYNPASESCNVIIQLWNNNTVVQASPAFTDIGSNINHVMSFPLLPGDWSMTSGIEYGSIKIVFTLFNGFSTSNICYNYVIEVFPEQICLEPSYISYINDSSQRALSLDLVYYVTSVQNGSYHEPGLGFFRDILDPTGTILESDQFVVNATGYLDISLPKDAIISTENLAIRIGVDPSNYIEPLVIVQNMSQILNRSNITVYYSNAMNIFNGTASYVDIIFQIGVLSNLQNIEGTLIYVSWNLTNSNATIVGSGNIMSSLGSTFNVSLSQELTAQLETLTLELWFEGNFVVNSLALNVSLNDIFSRGSILVTPVNLPELFHALSGNIVLQCNDSMTLAPLGNYTTFVEWVQTSTELVSNQHYIMTDYNGCSVVNIPGAIIPDIESYELVFRALSSSEYKECDCNISMASVFSRCNISVVIVNESSLLDYDFTQMSGVTFRICSANDSSKTWPGVCVTVDVIDAAGVIVNSQQYISNIFGELTWSPSASFIEIGEKYLVQISINATLQYKGIVTSCEFLAHTSTKNAGLTESTSIILTGTGLFVVLGFIRVWKRTKVITKKNFYIKIK